MDKKTMSPEVFKQVRDFIYEKCGMFFGDNKVYLLEDRLSRRLAHLNFSTYEEYLYYLRYDARRTEEIKNLYDSITTNETSFFRDMQQLDGFIDDVLPMVLAAKRQGDKSLRLWSAGCSTGEEPYTLAMMMTEKGLQAQGWRIEILASDISEHVLTSARAAKYGDYSVRNAPEKFMRKYFTNQGKLGMEVVPQIKQMVTFRNINLFDAAQLQSVAGMDVIFCRNVIIYFDDNSKRKVIGTFYDRLNPSGVLVLGFSESIISLTRAFKPKGIKKCVVYQKA
jgi:chemotaxis protein methyltransferase CheR